MPDSDRAHAGLKYRYQKPYKQLCEGYISNEELAYNILKPLKKDIQDYGDGPINLIKKIGKPLEEKTSIPIFKQFIDYKAESQNIESLAQKTTGDPRGIALAEKTCEEVLQAIQRGEVNQVCTEQIMQKYIENVCNTNFIQIIPLIEKHYSNVDQATLDQRLENIQPHLNQDTADMAAQIMQKDQVKSLRMPKRLQSHSPIDIYNDDLLSI